MSTPTTAAQALSAQAVNWANRTLVTSKDSNIVSNLAKVTARAAVDTALIVAALVETVVNAVLALAAAPVSLVKSGAFTHMKERTVSSATAMLDAGKGIVGLGPLKGDNLGATGPVKDKRPEGFKGYIHDAKEAFTKALAFGRDATKSATAHVQAHKYAYIGGGAALVAAAGLGLDHRYGKQLAANAPGKLGDFASAAWKMLPSFRGKGAGDGVGAGA